MDLFPNYWRGLVWGDDDGSATNDGPSATTSVSTRDFNAVSAGAFHTCGVKTDGAVACWGEPEGGRATPPAGEFLSVSAGGAHTCGMRADGSVECWGSNRNPRNGIFVGQASLPHGSFTSVSAGWLHTCGVRIDGSVECWGQRRPVWQNILWPSDAPRRLIRLGQRWGGPHLRDKDRRLGPMLGVRCRGSGPPTRRFLRFR